MLTKIMKCVCVAGLLAALLWRSSEEYSLLLQLAVSAGAVLVSWEAYWSEKQVWAIGFVAIAALFNPFQPLTFSPGMFLFLSLLSMIAFLGSLAVLKARPKGPMPAFVQY